MTEKYLDNEFINACRYHQFYDIKKYVEKGFNINRLIDGFTPLTISTIYVNTSIVKYLILNGADISIINQNKTTCLDIVKMLWEHYELQKLIIEKNPTTWFKNFKKHNIKLHKWIKEEYPEESITDELGFFESVNQKELNEELLDACVVGDLEKIKELLKSGANINYEDKNGSTAIIISYIHGNLEIVKYLLNCGVDINSKNIGGCTPLMASSIVCYLPNRLNKKIEVIIYLMQHGADIELKNFHDRTCFKYQKHIWIKYELQKAIMNNYPNGYRILKENNIEIHPKIKQEYPEESIPDELGFFEGFKESEELIDLCKVAPDLKKIKELVENGADVNFKDKLNNTVLSWACSCDNLEVVKYLIKKGADINNTDKNGSTPIIVAAYNHLTKIVQYLIEQGADVSVIDNDNDSCFDNRNLIDFWSSYEIQKLLIKKDMKNIYLLSKHGISIHPKIKQEYPEEIIVDELGFFN